MRTVSKAAINWNNELLNYLLTSPFLGNASFGWGISEIIAGFIDQDLSVPAPAVGVTVSLLATQDLDTTCKTGIIIDALSSGAQAGSMAARVPDTLEMLNLGSNFLDTAIQAESNSNQFSTQPQR
jgi:hypothetical protein